MIRFLLFCLMLSLPAFAEVTLEEPMPDPAREAEAQALFREIRCVVCQSESIAESSSPFAADLRADIRRRLAGGEAPDAILPALAEHYGAAIKLNPDMNAANLGLWLIPLVVFLGGGWLFLRQFRSR
ncbi:MAG: cytochrome c-type biogenesis protein CcmH [Alphaproteobacteria bacterium]|nr:cytochrome c-type biogenesis protein CcmH [Alphaproteobacteria bacterium]